jgi:hypothetical protein
MDQLSMTYLDDLQPNHELYTPAGVQLTRANAKEHVEVRVVGRFLRFQSNNVANILVFGNGLRFSRSISTAKTTQDEPSFFVAANFGEPSRRLWEEPDYAEKDEQWDDLKRNGKAPCNGRVAAIHERETEFKPISHYDTENVQAMS